MTPNSSKPRVIKDFDKLENHIQEQIKLSYPYGFSDHLIRFTNKDGLYVSALPFETDEKYYLVRMTVERAEEIIEDDDVKSFKECVLAQHLQHEPDPVQDISEPDVVQWSMMWLITSSTNLIQPKIFRSLILWLNI